MVIKRQMTPIDEKFLDPRKNYTPAVIKAIVESRQEL